MFWGSLAWKGGGGAGSVPTVSWRSEVTELASSRGSLSPRELGSLPELLMISLLYFKPGKRAAGGDLMIGFVMEKRLVWPVCSELWRKKARWTAPLRSDPLREHIQNEFYTHTFIFLDYNFT